MTVLSINERIIRAKDKVGLENVDFEVLHVSKSSAKVLNEMAAYVVSVMNTEDTEESPFDPLEFRVYNATDDSGDYIADATITLGGPTVTVRYEASRDVAVISYHWCSDFLEVSTRNAPIVEIIKTHSTYF